MRIIYRLFVALFTIGVFISGGLLYREFSEYKKGTDSYGKLENFVTAGNYTAEKSGAGDADAGQTKAVIPETLEVDFDALCQLNPDVTGWILLPGTRINYPIVQGEDNEYYLTCLFDGTPNSSGAIFMDAAASSDFSDDNTIIYGHHMKNGSMFADLSKYRDEGFFAEHPVILLATPGGTLRAEVFSAYVADVKQDAWRTVFSDSGDKESWLAGLTARSAFAGAETPGADDRIVTLSTCTYEFDDARFVVHAAVQGEETEKY